MSVGRLRSRSEIWYHSTITQSPFHYEHIDIHAGGGRRGFRRLSGSTHFQPRGRVRHRGGRAVGGEPLGHILRAAHAELLDGQALRGQAGPYARHPRGVHRRHAGEQAHTQGVQPALHRALRDRREGQSARDEADQRRRLHQPLRTPHRVRAPPLRPCAQDLHDDDGGGRLRDRRRHAQGHRALPRREHPGLRKARRRASPRLPREGRLHRAGAPRLRQQRRVHPRGDEGPDDYERRPCAVERKARQGELGGRAQEPVHRRHVQGRDIRRRRSREGSALGDRLGLQERHPDGPRRRQVAQVPPPQGLAQLRRRARVEHRVAAHPRDRRGRRLPDDDARHVLALPRDDEREELGGDTSALELPQDRRRLLPLGRQARAWLRRHRGERVPQQAQGEGRARGACAVELQPLVRRPEGPRLVRARHRARGGVAARGREEGRGVRPVPPRRIRQAHALRLQQDAVRFRHRSGRQG